jgi:hypothetical protein
MDRDADPTNRRVREFQSATSETRFSPAAVVLLALVALGPESSGRLSHTRQAPTDTVRIGSLAAEPEFDGRADSAKWGTPTIRIVKQTETVFVWLKRTESGVFLAVELPDTTDYWGDDFVISLDTRGDRARSPQHDDFQWYFRRVLDSSVVYRGNEGRWMEPLGDPDWRLGKAREGGGWQVRSVSTRHGWSLELKLDAEWLAGESGRSPGLAFRSYDDGPNGWFVWPNGSGLAQPTQLERRPDRWAVVLTPRSE